MGPDWLRGERQDEGKGRVARNTGYGQSVGDEDGGTNTPASPCWEEEERGLGRRAEGC